VHIAEIQNLYDYSAWANAKLLAVVAQLTPEQFTQRVAGAYGSIRNTLVHVLSAEWGWLDRCGGHPRGARLSPDDFPTADHLITAWQRVDAWMRDFLGGLTDEDLARDVEFKLGDGPPVSLRRGELLRHAVLHAVHHRGQVAVLLREIGCAPGNFDYLIYATEHARLSA
jgi:uncharacterized damage-inducible protein DinB